jgi:hypothetical protein
MQSMTGVEFPDRGDELRRRLAADIDKQAARGGSNSFASRQEHLASRPVTLKPPLIVE